MRNGLPLLLILIITTAYQRLTADSTVRTFHKVKQHLKWAEARDYCRAHFTALASVRTDQELDQLPGCEQCWLGLKREVEDVWRWSEGLNVSFTRWQGGHPHPDAACVSMKGRGRYWTSEFCHEEYDFICYELEDLILVEEKKTWEEALEHCRSHFRDLASVLTNEDFGYAQSLLQDAQTDQVWTGLRYLGGEWWWVHGDLVQNQDLPVCPAQDRLCGTLPKTGNALATENCEERRNFLCYAN